MQTALQSRQVRPRTAKVSSLEQHARYARQGHPALLWRGDLLPAEPVNENGAITNLNAGGKWYVDPTGTLRNAAAGVPYVHHVHDGSSYTPRGVLWEPAITNLITYSAQLDQWTAVRTDIDDDAAAGPTGDTVADLLTCNSGSASGSYINSANGTITAADTVTGSVHIKPGTTSVVCVQLHNGGSTNGVRQYFTLSGNGTVGSSGAFGSGWAKSTARIEPRANGFYRVSLTVTTAVDTTAKMLITIVDADNSLTVTLGKTLYGWGAQIEKGGGPSSYIPTVAAPVARTADTASISSAFLTPIKGAGRITVRYTPNAASSGAVRTLFDCRSGTDGFVLYIAADGKLSVNWNGAVRATAALVWAAGTTYEIQIKWSGVSVTLSRDSTIGYGPTDQAAGLSTIGATVYLGATFSGANQADGAVQLIEAVAA